jgi:hypothetical protein
MPSDTARSYGANYSLPTVHTLDGAYANTYPIATSFCINQEVLPPEILAYFRAALRDRFHDLVLEEFTRQKSKHSDLTQAEIARRLGKRPEQINRWLGSSGNWTIDTLSDLLLAICAGVPRLSVEYLAPEPSPTRIDGWQATLPVAGQLRASMNGAIASISYGSLGAINSNPQLMGAQQAGITQ